MKRFLLGALLALFAQLVFAAPEDSRDADVHFFQVGFGDLQEEMQLAVEASKQGLFLMFGAEDCPPCKKMKQTVLNRPHIQDYYREHFRVLYIDFNGDVEVTDLTGRKMREKDYSTAVARVIGTPTFLFLAPDGTEPARHAGVTRDVEEFRLLAQFVVSGAYRSASFSDYQREQRANAQ